MPIRALLRKRHDAALRPSRQFCKVIKHSTAPVLVKNSFLLKPVPKSAALHAVDKQNMVDLKHKVPHVVTRVGSRYTDILRLPPNAINSHWMRFRQQASSRQPNQRNRRVARIHDNAAHFGNVLALVSESLRPNNFHEVARLHIRHFGFMERRVAGNLNSRRRPKAASRLHVAAHVHYRRHGRYGRSRRRTWRMVIGWKRSLTSSGRNDWWNRNKHLVSMNAQLRKQCATVNLKTSIGKAAQNSKIKRDSIRTVIKTF